ncbi:NAD(P)/FAD-dependent oxidoreductase [Aliikangiella marina]|uniref:NAD(P)/FAD-dependent oxidoreductase n=1 Tax=Aliikangiella marina TaxID=1712262 RepID=A0A545T7E4_9GAMM|nr:NAD(P)/FAD-dependent oxidoreductase [Aliikangiella marina]TQV73141.1 NAD(P)/FAD-dependent oxidoreductase [Aliikangiella marina]
MTDAKDKESIEYLDVLIVGAGISGIGMCYQLKNQRPNDKFAVIESRANFGGTWDLFKYPGIRSDSDMYTFAYSFKPWTDREHIGSAERINHYLTELVDDANLKQFMRFEQKVVSGDWDSNNNHWLMTIEKSSGERYQIATKFLTCCAGYYNYEQGYLPRFTDYDKYQGVIAHPQHWPEDLDYKNKTVLVIGSGATAVTIVPNMAEQAAKVTMLQRSPTYIVSRPASDLLFRILSHILPSQLTNKIMRAKYISLQQLVYIVCQKFPKLMKMLIRWENKKVLNDKSQVDIHFKPQYNPWDQRMCLDPEAKLFNSINQGKTEIVTNHIERFTDKGVVLKDGTQINADIIVPATGLELQLWGKMNLTIDGAEIDSSRLTNYKGMMFSQVPNFVWIFGYTNASWTLKAELTFDYICRLLAYMEDNQYQSVYPYRAPDAPQEKIVALKSGYIMRALDWLPSQGSQFPWCNKDLYFKDMFAIKRSRLDDGVLRFDDNRPLSEFHSYETPTPNKRGTKTAA